MATHWPKRHNILSGNSGRYVMKKLLGQGTFGKVFQCIKTDTGEKVAVKVVRKDDNGAGENEVSVLKELRKLDQEKNNLVSLVDHFNHEGHLCLVFEMLHVSVYDLMDLRYWQPLHLSEIRVITQQMLVALNALKSIGLVHSDIKPDNVMLVNQQLQPFKVKLIDFGLAFPLSEFQQGSIIQPIGYRAPEVMLGLPCDEAIDMWSLGCVLAFMYIGNHLYPLDCVHENMRGIVKMQGQPDNDLLDRGVYTREYFDMDQGSSGASWRPIAQGDFIKMCIFDDFTSLDDIAKTRPGVKDATEEEDTQAFISLLKCMLQVDPKKRITPSEALGHRFVTMKHFPSDSSDNGYVKSAYLTIEDSQLEQPSVEFRPLVTSSEVMRGNGASITGSDEPLSADEETAAAAGSNYTTAAVADKTTAGSSDGPPVEAGLDEVATDYVEVKSRNKWFKRIRQFFSRMVKPLRC